MCWDERNVLENPVMAFPMAVFYIGETRIRVMTDASDQELVLLILICLSWSKKAWE